MIDRRRRAVTFLVALGLVAPFLQSRAAAQTRAADTPTPTTTSVRPYATVRFHAGPNLNVMHDWRQGIDALGDLASQRGLTPHRKCCISKSWGTTALVHVTDRFAVGGSYEALRDTREFSVTDTLDAFGLHEDAEFSFDNHTEVAAKQVVVALYPRPASHTHVQFGGGIGTGRTLLSTPGSSSSASLRSAIVSVSAGTEARFWYVDAGWRFIRMRTTGRTASDFAIDKPRDVFADVRAVQEFVQRRDVDLSGAWARIGIALHLGRR